MQLTNKSMGNNSSINSNRLPSILAFICIFCKLINAVIGKYTSLPAGLVMMSFGWLLLLIYLLLNHERGKKTINVKKFGFLSLIAIYFLISNIVSSGYCRDLTLSFVEYGLFGFIVGILDFQPRLICKYASIGMLILAIPIYSFITSDIANTRSQTIMMGVVYAILPGAFVSITHFLFFRRKKRYELLSFVISVAVIIMIVLRGNRGAILCIGLFPLLLLFQRLKAKTAKTTAIFISLLVLIVVMANIETLLAAVSDILSSWNVSINVVTKSLRLISGSDDITNGRTGIYHYAIDGFCKSPIFGNGIGSFHDKFPLLKYPHNIFLQTMYEGGIVMTLPIAVAMFQCVRVAVMGNGKTNDLHALLPALIACTVPAVMLTGELWDYSVLWLLFGIVIGRGSSHGNATRY